MENSFNRRVILESALVVGFRIVLVTLPLLNVLRVDRAGAVTPHSLRPHVCRVTNQLEGSSDLGSGTLIHKTTDGHEGLVLTCAHLFREGVGNIIVRFADGHAHHATLIDVDSKADLAALAIAHPVGIPVAVSSELNTDANLYACGYGPRGLYRCAIGPKLGRAESSGQVSLLVGDAVRAGDSGGGVFDEQGRLVAVIWGESQGVTYASYGKPLKTFISRILGRKTSSLVRRCPNGVCPRRPVDTVPSISGDARDDARWDEFQRQLDELRNQKQDRGDYLRRNELPSFGQFALVEDIRRLESEASTRHTNLLEQVKTLTGRSAGRALGKAAAGLLGLSGPAGWAVVVASAIGGWLIGKQMKRKSRGAGGRRRRRFRA